MQPIQRRILFISILLLGLGWIYLSADQTGASTSGAIPAPRKGFLAPDFTLKTLEGETVHLSDYRGQAVLLNLWATWCPPCRAEMPAIQKMYEKYKDQGFIVLAVDMTYQDVASDVEPFVQDYGLTFPILMDTTGQAASLYELRSLPSSYFIDRDGIIQEVVIGGPMAEALLLTRIKSLIGK